MDGPIAIGSGSSPLIYEINTWPWLSGLSARHDRPVDLGSVPGDYWDEIAELGFDAVWLMGVWERSPQGVRIARDDAPLMASLASALPDVTDDDVVGSPYCIRDYLVDDHLGGDDRLAVARAELARRGVCLILDFVPNHLAADHGWTTAHPEWFIRGTAADLERDPDSFIRVGDHVFANGRDPYFPAWRDVVQINAFHDGLRDALRGTALDIAGRCDGVRCDMAMLVLSDVFARTWGERAGDPPAQEFWPPLIEGVRAVYPGFVFIAEAYWGTEATLVAQGFDHCYDKGLYDVLRDNPPHLWPRLSAEADHDTDRPRQWLRFIENHDEPRAAQVFGDGDRRAAVATLTQQGARLVHQGQIEGRRIRVPVQLGRFPDEPTDVDRAVFYRALVRTLHDDAFTRGSWRLCDTQGPSDAVVAWERESDTRRWVVAVNISDQPVTMIIDDGCGSGAIADAYNPLTGETRPISGDAAIEISLIARGWQMFRIDLAS